MLWEAPLGEVGGVVPGVSIQHCVVTVKVASLEILFDEELNHM